MCSSWCRRRCDAQTLWHVAAGACLDLRLLDVRAMMVWGGRREELMRKIKISMIGGDHLVLSVSADREWRRSVLQNLVWAVVES